MKTSELAAAPASTALPPSIPVICDKCRAEGMAGDPVFAAIPDILAFEPVKRRAHVNNWTAEHQRAFIAALAITGSPRQAARAIGRHQFGAEQLRTARGGKGFAEAWEAAMELARERETHRLHANLAELARTREAELARVSPSPARAGEDARFGSSGGRAAAGHGEGLWHDGPRPIHPDCDYDPDIHTDDYPDYWDSIHRVRTKLLMCRRFLLAAISDDPDKRAAWEVLVGPVDWARAERMEPQADEPIRDPEQGTKGMPNMRQSDMVLVVEAGLLPEWTGGTIAELREFVAEEEARNGLGRLA